MFGPLWHPEHHIPTLHHPDVGGQPRKYVESTLPAVWQLFACQYLYIDVWYWQDLGLFILPRSVPSLWTKNVKQKYGAVVFSILQKVNMYKPSNAKWTIIIVCIIRIMKQYCELIESNVGNYQTQRIVRHAFFPYVGWVTRITLIYIFQHIYEWNVCAGMCCTPNTTKYVGLLLEF